MTKIKFLCLCLLCMALCSAAACKNTDDRPENTAAPTAAAIRTAAASASPAAGTASAGSPAAEATPAGLASPTAEPTERPAPPTVRPGQHTYAEGIKSDAPVDIYYFDTNPENGVQQLFDSIAVQFFPTSEFNAIYVSCPSLNDDIGTITFELFPWMGTYDATVSGAAAFARTFEDYKDNELIKLALSEPLPDGEYLIYMTTPAPEEGVGVWVKLDDFEGQRMYVDDVPIEHMHAQIQLSYINTPNNIHGKISDLID